MPFVIITPINLKNDILDEFFKKSTAAILFSKMEAILVIIPKNVKITPIIYFADRPFGF